MSVIIIQGKRCWVNALLCPFAVEKFRDKAVRRCPSPLTVSPCHRRLQHPRRSARTRKLFSLFFIAVGADSIRVPTAQHTLIKATSHLTIMNLLVTNGEMCSPLLLLFHPIQRSVCLFLRHSETNTGGKKQRWRYLKGQ